jgi:hypothetical protein
MDLHQLSRALAGVSGEGSDGSVVIGELG